MTDTAKRFIEQTYQVIELDFLLGITGQMALDTCFQVPLSFSVFDKSLFEVDDIIAYWWFYSLIYRYIN